MWTIQEVLRHLRHESLRSEPWGISGDRAVSRVEGELGVRLEQQLRDFVREVGNLRVAPFSILIAGDEEGLYSAVTQTRPLWTKHPPLGQRGLIKVMEHAGEDYLYDPTNERVCAYDALHSVGGAETMCWDTFSGFVEWVVDEAKLLQRAMGAKP